VGPVAALQPEAGAAVNGPTVILIVFSIAGSLVLAFLTWEKDQQERHRREFDGIDEWEQVKRDLGPRSLP
jgi:hypothetical protein